MPHILLYFVCLNVTENVLDQDPQFVLYFAIRCNSKSVILLQRCLSYLSRECCMPAMFKMVFLVCKSSSSPLHIDKIDLNGNFKKASTSIRDPVSIFQLEPYSTSLMWN